MVRLTSITIGVTLALILAVSCAPKAPPITASTSLIDEVVFFEEPDSAKAVRMIEAGDMQVYASGNGLRDFLWLEL